jgi:hypothetical protein
MIIHESDFKNEVSNKSILINVHNVLGRKHYVDQFNYLIEMATEVAKKVVVFVGNPPEGTINRNGFQVIRTSWRQSDQQHLENLAKYHKFTIVNLHDFNDEVYYSLPTREFAAFDDVFNIQEEVGLSILSVWLERNLLIEKRALKNQYERQLLTFDYFLYELAKRQTVQICRAMEIEKTLVLNGRYPFQVGTRHGAEECQSDILFWERGFLGANRIFIEKFQTHSIPSMNRLFGKIIDSLDSRGEAEAIKWASEYLKKQTLPGKGNRFVGLEGSAVILNGESRRRAVIFNSSIDERISNLGVEMNGWRSQPEAIEAIAKKLYAEGYSVLVRIHPNTGWKSFRELIYLCRILNNSNIDIQLPWQGPSTYWHLSNCDLVVTWSSTVSLESTARGIPTINLTRSKFDQIIDVSIYSGYSDKKEDLVLISPEVHKSLLAIYASRNYGIKIESKVSYSFQESNKKQKLGFIIISKIKDVGKRIKFFALDPLSAQPYMFYFLFRKILGKSLGTKLLTSLFYFLYFMVNKRVRKELIT